uniref:Uncharacterized protein n=1 Tax=Arundo donax TaxID=35708 RepID=A0A0A9H621_ARUDO
MACKDKDSFFISMPSVLDTNAYLLNTNNYQVGQLLHVHTECHINVTCMIVYMTSM